MALVIFDLDNTLLSGDSDYEWGRFLVEQGLVDGEVYERENAKFYRAYAEGSLDILAFLAFALKPLSNQPMETLNRWHTEFMREKILPLITDSARALVKQHQNTGDAVLIVTATNRFVTEPIAKEFGIKHLIATDLEQVDNCYTGRVSGIPCFREGKIEKLQTWLKANNQNLEDSTFYSDSHNDLPLLNLVSRPIAVNPDTSLHSHAKQHRWTIIDHL